MMTMTKLLLSFLIAAALAIAQVPAPPVMACAATPGNTTGRFLSLCSTTAGAIYSCTNSGGCTVAGDWVAVGAGGGLPPGSVVTGSDLSLPGNLSIAITLLGPKTIGAGANQVPAASTVARGLTIITDGSSASDCTSGGGSTVVPCFSNGTVWGPLGSSSAAAWGSITGTLSSQTDLNTALGLKAPLVSPSFTTPNIGAATATSINGVGSATIAFLDATSSIQTQLNTKAPIASPTFTGHPTIEGVTSTGATGTGNLVYDASPTIKNPIIGGLSTTTLTTTSGTLTLGTVDTFAITSKLKVQNLFFNQTGAQLTDLASNNIGSGIFASIGTSGFTMATNAFYGFSSDSWGSGWTSAAIDTAFGRSAAGMGEINSGTSGAFRDLRLRHAVGSGTSPTIASGFGTSPSIAGADDGGRITVGSGGSATTGVITFGTAYTTNAPSCTANNETTVLLIQAVATTTTLTLNASSAFGAGDKITWTCRGYL